MGASRSHPVGALTCPVLLQVVLQPRHQRALGLRVRWGTSGPQPQQVQSQPPRLRVLLRVAVGLSVGLAGFLRAPAGTRGEPRGQGTPSAAQEGTQWPQRDVPAVAVLEGVPQPRQVPLLPGQVMVGGQAKGQVDAGVGLRRRLRRQPQQPGAQLPRCRRCRLPRGFYPATAPGRGSGG